MQSKSTLQSLPDKHHSTSAGSAWCSWYTGVFLLPSFISLLCFDVHADTESI